MVRDKEGYLCTEEGNCEGEKQLWGSFKVERLLYLTARSLALANWADLEALVDFYEGMLEAIV